MKSVTHGGFLTVYKIVTFEMTVTVQKEDLGVTERNIRKMSAQYLINIRKDLLGKDLAKDTETFFMSGTRTC